MTNPGDLERLMNQMGSLQAQLAGARDAAAATEVVGDAGQGAVRVRVRGEFDFTAVEIDPSIVADGDAELVGDLCLAAIRDAVARLAAAQRQAVGAAATEAIAKLLGAASDADPTD